jgi:general stress protein 26
MERAMDHNVSEIDRLLAGTSKVVKSIPYCWLATKGDGEDFVARPMGRIPLDLDEDEWLVRFITDRRSNKAAGIVRTPDVALIFQRETDDAYVMLSGGARLRENASKDQRHWKSAYKVYFPTDDDLANAAFIEIEVSRMALWIRGVTPEPFGLRPTLLERETGQEWRLIG